MEHQRQPMQECLTECLKGMVAGEVRNAKNGYIEDSLEHMLQVSKEIGL